MRERELDVADPMISTEELAAILGAPDTRIVDASWHLDARDALAEHAGQHLPGAVFFDIDAIADRNSRKRCASSEPRAAGSFSTCGRKAGALDLRTNCAPTHCRIAG